jgi:proteasome accessory factor A
VPRILGLETEFAVHFIPERAGEAEPTHEAVFRALVAALKTRIRSCEALYYKGGDFFENGSLVHFEVGRLEDPTTGLLEWASPECLSARELALYSKAQERALVLAIPDAEKHLAGRGYLGRVVVVKNNRDRFGNDYGTHESYDARERPLGFGRRIARGVLHPLALGAIALGALAAALPFLAFFLTLFAVLLVSQLLAILGPLRRFGDEMRGALGKVASFLVEVGPRAGSGALPRTLLWVLRAAAVVYSSTARLFMLHGHIPQILPFLATRPAFAGAGWLSPEGRYELSPRARALRRTVSAFIFGPQRPMVDLKEYFYRRPFSYKAPRKRLHLLVGDANRSEYAERLKLATTAAVLDAIEAGALDEVAARISLFAGPLGALRATARDLGFTRPIARDRHTGASLTALDVQRRYLEAVWDHFRRQTDALDPETKDALARWAFVLDQLAQDPLALDRELDWVVKKRLLDRTLADALPGIPLDEAWARLAAFGELNALVERRAPHLDLPPGMGAAELEGRLAAALGARAVARATRSLPPGLGLEPFPEVRRAWLRLKLVDLRYHEVSVEGGYFDWLERDGLVAREFTEPELERALVEPPARTRARIRSDFVRRATSFRACRVGWDRIVIEPRGEPARTIRIADPYAFDDVP